MAFIKEITAIEAVVIGDVSGGVVGVWLIQLDDNSSSGFAARVEVRAREGANTTRVALNYIDRKTTATAPVIDALSATELIVVDAAGLEVRLDVTAISSGGVYLNAVPLIG